MKNAKTILEFLQQKEKSLQEMILDAVLEFEKKGKESFTVDDVLQEIYFKDPDREDFLNIDAIREPIKNVISQNNFSDRLEEAYSDEELDAMIGKVYNLQKIEKIDWKKKYDDKRLMAKTICTKCGREKNVFLSNLIKDPDKYGSCVCSETNVDGKIDYAKSLYNGTKVLSSNTSGYTGVTYVRNMNGKSYNKWRAYIEVDGVRSYLGDFDAKKDAIEVRKLAGEKGIKWYKENRNRILKNMRKKQKKYFNSKYKDTDRKIKIKTDKKDAK